jgi:hypothetical protein
MQMAWTANQAGQIIDGASVLAVFSMHHPGRGGRRKGNSIYRDIFKAKEWSAAPNTLQRTTLGTGYQ